MKITEGWELAQGAAGYRLLYSDGSTVFIDRAPNDFEIKECLIEPVMIDGTATPTPPESDKLRKAAEFAASRLEVYEDKYAADMLRDALERK